MAEHCIIVDVDEYKELVEKAERIATVERLVNSGDYVSEKNILSVLSIKKKENADGEV
jgi:phage pi2 protein 07